MLGRANQRTQVRAAANSERLYERGQITLLVLSEAEIEVAIIVIDDVDQRCETPVMVETALLLPIIPARGVVRYLSSGERFAWKSSIPISSGVCMFHPGSVYNGGTWHVAHCAFPANNA
jgi:hypothetical protein